MSAEVTTAAPIVPPAAARVPGPAAGSTANPAANPLVAWLLDEGWRIPDAREFVNRLVGTLLAEGLPISRMRITLRILHPQVIGNSYTWSRSAGEVEESSPPHSVVQSDAYLKSPYPEIYEGAGAIRRRLDDPSVPLEYPILEELRATGATDYVAMPIHFSDGKINVITFASDRPGGFSTDELSTLYGMLPALGRIVEVHAMRHTARTILNTYLGRQSGERVLHGLIKRGDGDDIHAIIWFCDLRDSTALADHMPRQEFLALLNDFFECMAGAVLDHGGEVLRFIGDAVLAIFPVEARGPIPEDCPHHGSACQAALAAARDAMERVEALNARRAEAGDSPLEFGIALHLGEVTYGNIGVANRLEFSVIGAAANEAARIESLCKTLRRPLLISAELARVVPENWVSLGHHALRGVESKREIFTLAELAG